MTNLKEKILESVLIGPIAEAHLRAWKVVAPAIELLKEQRRDAIILDGRSMSWEEINKQEIEYENELNELISKGNTNEKDN